GQPRYKASIARNIHESPLVMTIPLMLLAIGAIASGYYGEEILHILSPNQEMWHNALVLDDKTFALLSNLHHLDAIYAYLPMILSVIGITSAFMVYLIRAKKETTKKAKAS